MRQFIEMKKFKFHHFMCMCYVQVANHACAMMKRHNEKCLHYAIKMGVIDPNKITFF